MRGMITASRRAKAAIALFSPRRLAIVIAQALRQDHLVVRYPCSLLHLMLETVRTDLVSPSA